jgi:4-deoxy-L-threo-5-hexosulose-uronate ketol-isomerase
MEIRNPVHPRDFRFYTTEQIRQEFLVQKLFAPNKMNLVYSHFDRMIVGGVCPVDPVSLAASKEVGANFFLERREMGVINIGPSGSVTVDGHEYPLGTRDGLYIGMGSEQVVFHSLKDKNPARFYVASGPAHLRYPCARVQLGDAQTTRIGAPGESNVRTLRKYIHPEGVKSCQLVMGMTSVEPNNVWNSMPCHTHARRMEVYFYFDLPDDAVVFHLMGEPDETRHIVVRNEEAVISPSWSIHAGVGTANYTFIWAMVGENQTFTDMDAVAMPDIR